MHRNSRKMNALENFNLKTIYVETYSSYRTTDLKRRSVVRSGLILAERPVEAVGNRRNEVVNCPALFVNDDDFGRHPDKASPSDWQSSLQV